MPGIDRHAALRALVPTSVRDPPFWATCGAPPCATCVAHNRAFCHVGGRECLPVLTGELRQAAASQHLWSLTGPDVGAAGRIRVRPAGRGERRGWALDLDVGSGCVVGG